MKRIIVIPAVFIGCLIVIWVGTVAAAGMPVENVLTPSPAVSTEDNPSSMEETTANGQPKSQESAAIGESAANPDQNCTLPTSYPDSIRQWCSLIEKSAGETGLPANLIAAVMLQESGGDSLSYSSSGAVGLMQVMPRDGLAADFMCVNGPCFSERPTIAELQDPAFNVAYGTQMLADLYAKHGSYREALFRYGPINMGYYYADLVLKIYQNYQ
jgi:hypothetical protein